MGRPLKKNKSGASVTFISRKQTLKKLQLSLKDFRRLCILKGIYPVEPKRRQKIAGGNSSIKTYYHMKDVQFLLHEPIIKKFRESKVFFRRLRKAINKKEPDRAKAIRENWPVIKVDHIVKERYPSFLDAIRDLDDALSMCFLTATFPKGRSTHVELIQLCRRLSVEFMHYIIQSRSLRKVFISIKGFYYQADICGQTITWVIPHTLGHQPAVDVDFRIMLTFTEFYSTMLGFINYRLYQTANLVYPPKLSNENIPTETEPGEMSVWIEALNHSLKSISSGVDASYEPPDEFPDLDDPKLKESINEAAKLKKFQDLFKDLKIFLNREVPRESLAFIIRCFGGTVSWSKTVCDVATFDESDETITHHIIDRPGNNEQYLNRYYVQPQWVFDSINARMLLPVQRYFPGVLLPPHLSPFVQEKEGDYVPPEKIELEQLQDGKVDTTTKEVNKEISDVELSDVEISTKNEELTAETKIGQVKSGKMEKEDKALMAKKEAEEEKRLAVMMIPKKRKRLYNKIIYGQKRRVREANVLKSKRENFEKSAKKRKVS